ncbi:MAG: DUF4214 domain-containing protein [Pseudoxanthomonas sp.]
MANPPHETMTDPALPGTSGKPAVPDSGSILSVDEIMLCIRQEVARRGGLLPSSVRAAPAPAPVFRLANWQPSAPRIPVKQEYALGELLSFSDSDFIENAYRAVLRRTPDEGGLGHHLSRLRNGQASKVEILAALRWSAEGEKAGVHVDGLLAPFLLQKWRRKRFIGPLIGWMHSLARLSTLADRQVVLDAAHARESNELGRILNQQAQQLQSALSEIDSVHRSNASEATAALERLSARMGEVVSRFGELDRLQADALTLAGRIDQLSVRLEALASVETLTQGLVEQTGSISARLVEIDEVRAHSHDVAGQVGTLSARLDELAGVQAHSHEVAGQVAGMLSNRLDALADVHEQARALGYRIDTVAARLDAQPDVVPVVRLISERIEDLTSQLQTVRKPAPAQRKSTSGNSRGK